MKLFQECRLKTSFIPQAKADAQKNAFSSFVLISFWQITHYSCSIGSSLFSLNSIVLRLPSLRVSYTLGDNPTRSSDKMMQVFNYSPLFLFLCCCSFSCLSPIPFPSTRCPWCFYLSVVWQYYSCQLFLPMLACLNLLPV